MSSQESFESIVGGQFDESEWASLGLKAELGNITADTRLSEFIIDIATEYYATADNLRKNTARISMGLPSDNSLLDARMLATQKWNVVTDIYSEITFDLLDPDCDFRYEEIVNRACMSRYSRNEALSHMDDTQKDELNDIAVKLFDLFIAERGQHFTDLV